METSVGLACALVMSAWILYAGQPCENWMAPYTGADATGEKVVGLWAFADLKDASGKGRDAVLHGAVLVPDDRWGSCLESFCGWPVEDECHAAIVTNHPSLSPRGAFTLEMWIKPKPEFVDCPVAFLMFRSPRCSRRTSGRISRSPTTAPGPCGFSGTARRRARSPGRDAGISRRATIISLSVTVSAATILAFRDT